MCNFFLFLSGSLNQEHLLPSRPSKSLFVLLDPDEIESLFKKPRHPVLSQNILPLLSCPRARGAHLVSNALSADFSRRA